MVTTATVQRHWRLPAAMLVLLVAVVVGASIGPAGPPAWRVPLELINRLPLISLDSGVSSTEWNLIWQIRMPRVVLAGLVGAMLSTAGAAYQGVFRNPLIDPYLLGVAAGAGLGATIVFTVNRAGTSSWIVDPLPLTAFVGGLGAVALTYLVGTAFGANRSSATLVLAGVAVTSLATALQTFILQRNTDVVRQVYSWILGRLSSATWSDVRLVIPYVILSLGALLIHRRLLDVLRVGDDEAKALGVNVDRVRLIVVFGSDSWHRSSSGGQWLNWFCRNHCSSRGTTRCRCELPSCVASESRRWCRFLDPCGYTWAHS